MLINSNASQYAAILSYISIYKWLYVQLIVIVTYHSRYKKGMLFGINIKNVKIPSYHSIYENVYKLQKIIFGQGFLVKIYFSN